MSLPRARHMLIEHDLVPVRIVQHDARRALAGLVGPGRQLQAAAFELLLDVADVIKVAQGFHAAIPAGVERQDVLVEHSLEQADRSSLILKDEKVLGGVAKYD